MLGLHTRYRKYCCYTVLFTVPYLDAPYYYAIWSTSILFINMSSSFSWVCMSHLVISIWVLMSWLSISNYIWAMEHVIILFMRFRAKQCANCKTNSAHIGLWKFWFGNTRLMCNNSDWCICTLQIGWLNNYE